MTKQTMMVLGRGSAKFRVCGKGGYQQLRPRQGREGLSKRWKDKVKSDMEVVGTREEDTIDRNRWRQLIRFVDP